MRLAFIIDLPDWYNYKNIQHAHSHVALLGWLTGIYYLAIIYCFRLKTVRYQNLFWLMQSLVFAMLISFPIEGYGKFSIVFTSSYLLLTYRFVQLVFQDIRAANLKGLKIHFLKASLIFLVLSSAGPWSVGIITAIGLKGSAWYYGAIQFYLHFLFNGWFIFAVIALFIAIVNDFNIYFNNRLGLAFFYVLIIATLLTFAHAISWSNPFFLLSLINSIGVMAQLIAFALFMILIKPLLSELSASLSPYTKMVWVIALLAIFIKVLIQSTIVIPNIAHASYSIRNFVIGFIHLLLLGGLSLFILGLTEALIGIKMNKLGTTMFIAGIVLSEICLFGQGILIWQGFGFFPYYYLLIFSAYCVVFLGLIIIIYKSVRPFLFFKK
jgi:hypothetical protein